MIIIQCILSILAVLTISCNAFGQWEWKHPMPQGNNLNKVIYAGGSDHAFVAVGQACTILRIVPVGSTWDIKPGFITGPSGTIARSQLKSVDIDPVTGFGVAVGEWHNDFLEQHAQPLLLRTSDYGKHWTVISLPTNIANQYRTFFDVSIVPLSQGQPSSSQGAIVVGSYSTILRTTDAGINWQRLDPATFTNLGDYIPPANTGNDLVNPSSGEDIFTGVDFYGSTGIIVGNVTETVVRDAITNAIVYDASVPPRPRLQSQRMVFMTKDGGLTWKCIAWLDQTTIAGTKALSFNINKDHEGAPNKVLLRDADHCIVGWKGGFLHNNELQNTYQGILSGGRNWIPGGPTSLLPGLGTDAGPYPMNSITSHPVYPNDMSQAFAVSNYGTIYNATNIWDWGPAVSQGRVTDGSAPEKFEDDVYSSFDFDRTSGYNLTGIMVGWKGVILATADGGITWTRILAMEKNYLNAIAFASGNLGIAVGDFGSILQSTDNGETWHPNQYAFHTNSNLNSIAFDAHETAGTIVADWGEIYTTGISDIPSYPPGTGNIYRWWRQEQSPTTNHLKSVCYTPNGTCFAVGIHGTIMRKQPGGQWQMNTTYSAGSAIGLHPERYNFYSVRFIDNNKGFIAGGRFNPDPKTAINDESDMGGVVLRTTDGGNTWGTVQNDLQQKEGILRGIDFFDDTHGVAIGYEFFRTGRQDVNFSSYVLYTTNGGDDWTKITTPGHGYTLETDGVVNEPLRWRLYDVRCSSASEFYAVGSSGTILQGKIDVSLLQNHALIIQKSNDRWPLRGIGKRRDNILFAVGYRGDILKQPLTITYGSARPCCGDNAYTLALDAIQSVAGQTCVAVNLTRSVGSCDLYGVHITIPSSATPTFSSSGALPLISPPASQNPTWVTSASVPSGIPITIGTFCVSSTTSITLQVDYLSVDGTTMCSVSRTILNPSANCCSLLSATLVPFSPTPAAQNCCYTLTTTIAGSIPSGCTVMGARVSCQDGTPISNYSSSSPTPQPAVTFTRTGSLITGNFCIQTNGNIIEHTLKIEYFNDENAVVCTKYALVACGCSCDSTSYNIIFTPKDTTTNLCCWKVDITSKSNTCDLYGVSIIKNTTTVLGGTNFSAGPIQPGQTRTIGTLCLDHNSMLNGTNVMVVYHRQDGSEMCNVVKHLVCGAATGIGNCCDSLQVRTEAYTMPQSPTTCCGYIHITQILGTHCGIYGVRIKASTGMGVQGGISLQGTALSFPPPGSQNSIGYYCVPAGGSGTVTVEFLDNTGTVKCSKSFTVSCPPAGTGKQGMNQQPTPGNSDNTAELRSIPNPASEETTIFYNLESGSPVKLELCNALGQTVSLLEEGYRSQGMHSLVYKTSGLSSGTYFLKLTYGSHVVSLPLLVAR